VRGFFGPPGSPRRVRLRHLALLGPVLRAALTGYRFTRQAREDATVALQRRRTDFHNRRATTVRNITRRNNRRAYERVYADEQLLDEYLAPVRVALYEEVAELAAQWRPRSVIDVGCGAGDLLRAVVDRASPGRVVGVDYARAGIERARQLVPSGEFHAESLYELHSVGAFELVLCTEVLEHLRDPDGAVRILCRLCAHSGAVVITVPDGAEDRWEGHRNFWTKSELTEFLEVHGHVEVSRMRRASKSLLAIVRPLLPEFELSADATSLPSEV